MIKSRRKLKPIAHKRRNYLYLLLAILFAITTGYIFLNFPPEHKFEFAKIKLPILPIFLSSFFIFIFSLFSFLLKRRLQGFIFAGFVATYLLMRLVGLSHWIFAFLFLALFITLELFIIKKK